MDYREDLVRALQHEAELIKKQTMLEVISVATACDTYEEFKNALYGIAIDYFRDMEKEGLVKPGTVDKCIYKDGKEESTAEMSDDMFMI